MKLNDLKIGTRLVLGTVSVLVLLPILAALGIVRMERLHDGMKAMINVGNMQARLAFGKYPRSPWPDLGLAPPLYRWYTADAAVTWQEYRARRPG